MKNAVDDLDLTPSEKEYFKESFDRIHEAFESLKPKASKDSDSKEKEKNVEEPGIGFFAKTYEVLEAKKKAANASYSKKRKK
jgi:hypothetical protein